MPAKNFAANITVGGALAASFRAAIGGAQKDISSLGKSLKSLNAAQTSIGKGKGVVDFDALKKARENMRGAEAAAKQLGETLAATKAPTRAMAEELAKAQVAAGRAKTKYDALRKTQLETIREVKAATGSYRTNADTVRKMGEASERAAARMALLKTSGERIATVGTAFRAAGVQVMRFGVVAAGAATAAGVAAFGLGKSFSQAGDEIGVAAEKIGVTTDALQQFRFIGKIAGVTADEMDTALGKLSLRMAESAQDGGKMAEELQKLGMGLSLAKLRAMGPEKAMLALADAMERTTDPNKRLSAAALFFGDRAGPRMVGVLVQGKKAMREQAAEARKLGGVMGKDMIGRARELDDEFDRLGTTMEGLRNTIGAELAPVIIDALKGIRGWLLENRESIRLMASEFGTWARKEGPGFIEGVKNAAIAVKDAAVAINTVVTATVGWTGAVYAVGTALAVGAIGYVVQFGTAIATTAKFVWTGVSAAWSLAGGIGGIGRAIASVMLSVAGFGVAVSAAVGVAAASVGVLVYQIIKYWDALPGIFEHGLQLAGEKIGVAIDYYKGLFSSMFGWIADAWNATWGGITAGIDKVAGWVGLGDSKASPGTAVAAAPAPGSGVTSPAGAGIAAPPAAVRIPSPATAPGAAGAGAASGPTTINIQAAPGQDPQAIAAAVDRRLREIDRERRRGGLSD